MVTVIPNCSDGSWQNTVDTAPKFDSIVPSVHLFAGDRRLKACGLSQVGPLMIFKTWT